MYLTGITPSGLNATSQGEIEVFQDTLASNQEIYSPVIQWILEAVQLSIFGEIDPEITFDWNPLKVVAPTEAATIRKTQADTDNVYIDAGVLLPDEVREHLAAEEDSPYAALDLSRELPEPMMAHAGEGPDEEGLSPLEEEPQEEEPPSAQDAAEFEESKHPRDQDGKFEAGSGGGVASAGKSGGRASKSGTLIDAGNDRKLWPAHIQALKLPPAWTDVRISQDPEADLQAVGKDSKGRAQYVYSQRFQQSQAAAKFGRISALMREYDGMAAQVMKDRQSSDRAVRANSDCMDLVMKMGIRPGSESDTKAAKKAYGATTLKGQHVKIEGSEVTLSFVGKKGIQLDLPVRDEALKAMLIERKKRAGNTGKLFAGISEKTLLGYSHSLDGGHFKTKDFRTHVGTSTAMREVAGMASPTNAKEYQKLTKEVGKRVSAVLGNTPTVALQSYIDPAVFAPWEAAIGK